MFNVVYAMKHVHRPFLITHCNSQAEELMLLHTDYFRQLFDISDLTLHDNMCLWPGWVVVCLDVTLIAVGWRNLLATGRDGCGGHCHTQSEVRPEGCVCMSFYCQA